MENIALNVNISSIEELWVVRLIYTRNGIKRHTDYVTSFVVTGESDADKRRHAMDKAIAQFIRDYNYKGVVTAIEAKKLDTSECLQWPTK